MLKMVKDVLAVILVQISGYKAEDYAKRHHSGYLGDAARQQTTEAVTAHADESEQHRSREDQTVVTIARI